MSGTDPTSEDSVPEAFDRWRPPARHLIPCYGSLRGTNRWRTLVRSLWMGVLAAVIAMLLSRLALLILPVGSLQESVGHVTFMLLPLIPLGVCLLLGVASVTSIPPTEGARRLYRLDDEERHRMIHAWHRERGPVRASMACPTGGWIQWVCNRARIVLDPIFPIFMLYGVASGIHTLPGEFIPDLELPVGVSESLLTLSIFAVFLVAAFMFFPRWRHTFLLAFEQLRSASDANHPAWRGCGHILHQLKADRCTECGHELNTWDSVMFHPGLDGLMDSKYDDPDENPSL